MITFYLLATALTLLALAVLIASVLRGGGNALDLETENVAIAREQLAALDTARRAGTMSESDHAEERARVETTLASELGGARRGQGSRLANAGLVATIAIGVPLASALLYQRLGQPEAILATAPGVTGGASAAAQAAATQQPSGVPALDELVPRLEQRLAEQPDDVMGWRLLGRTWIRLERFDRAVGPLERAIELEPGDAGTHALLAEARAMLAGGDLNGAALASLERALALDPQHEQTLWLLGIARQQAGRHEEAIDLLTRLRGIAQNAGNTEAVATIDEYLAVSNAASGRPVAPPAGTRSQETTTEQVAAQRPEATGASLTVRVSLGDAARAATRPEQAVFVYARAVDGPPMPLAVRRLTVADLPATVTLDESMAMLPNATLAGFADVTVGARVSRSGQPTAAPGDWSVERAATVGEDGTPDQAMTLTINEPVN